MSDVENESVPEGINDLPDPESFGAPAGSKRRPKKKRKIEESSGVSMNSLLDILTIILVFLLKSYSTDPVTLKQAEDLKPPFSSAQLKAEQSTTVTLTLNNLLVDDKPVLRIEQGVVGEGDTSSNGFLVDPLFQALQESVDHQKRVASFNSSAEFKGIITVISDRHVPFKLLSQVMYTAGQAQFSKFKFMVVKGG
jgi:biopolymer transport protein ExbD